MKKLRYDNIWFLLSLALAFVILIASLMDHYWKWINPAPFAGQSIGSASFLLTISFAIALILKHKTKTAI